MSTHGTIRLTDTEYPSKSILLQTSHNGHIATAIAMLCDLPRFIVQKSWYANVISRTKDPFNNVSIEEIVDFGKCEGDFAILYLLGFAHDIVHYHYDRWQIIPEEFKEDLADYDLDPEYHLKVELNPIFNEDHKEDGILIEADFEEYKDDSVFISRFKEKSFETVIQKINSKLPENAKINLNWTNKDGTKKGIFIPYYDRIIFETQQEVIRLSREKRRKISDLE